MSARGGPNKGRVLTKYSGPLSRSGEREKKTEHRTFHEVFRYGFLPVAIFVQPD
jgi:hypothetical protein